MDISRSVFLRSFRLDRAAPLLERFQKITEEVTESGARYQVWKDTVRIFLHFPVAGTGLGTFPEVFPVYRSFATDLIYSRAHNDYLQLLSELGVASLFLLLFFYLTLVRRIRILFRPPVTRFHLIQMGAFCALVSLGLHSFTDFSIQIPAIAVTGAILCALLFGSHDAENENIVTRKRIILPLLATLLVSVYIGLSYAAFQNGASNLAGMKTKPVIGPQVERQITKSLMLDGAFFPGGCQETSVLSS